jgi:hypothetical protein
MHPSPMTTSLERISPGHRGIHERWKLDPLLRRVLLHQITPLTSSPPIPLDNLSDEYNMLVLKPNAPSATSRCCLAFSPANGSDCKIDLGLPSSQNEATRSIHSLILVTCHDQCHAVWLLRNQHLHRTTPRNTTTPYKNVHLLAQIQELYDASPHMMTPHHEREIFAFPMECWQLESAATLTSFYRHAKPIAEKSIKDVLHFGRNFRRINGHFCPLLIPTTLFDVILGR